MTSVPEFSFSHMGMFVTDAARMEDFYTRVLGFAVTDRGRPGAAGFNAINQISFRMADLAGLREMHRRLQKEGVGELAPVSHGNACSVYFRDPEGNRVELFVDTPWYVQQPVRIPMDMHMSEAETWAWAEREARKLPGFTPVERWRASFGSPRSR
ncbi:MAG: VOC family protein [Burkholderiales bacterium]